MGVRARYNCSKSRQRCVLALTKQMRMEVKTMGDDDLDYHLPQEVEIELFEEGWDAACNPDIEDLDDFHDTIGFGSGDNDEAGDEDDTDYDADPNYDGEN